VSSSVSLLLKFYVHLAKEVHHSTLAWHVVESELERVWHHIMQIIGFIFSVMTEVFSLKQLGIERTAVRLRTEWKWVFL
jgi:hypothetical protein